MRMREATAVVSLTVAALVGACSPQPSAPAKTVTETVTVGAPTSTPPAPTAGIGQDARDGNFVFTVTAVRPLAGDMAGKGVAVLLTVKNVGTGSQTYVAADQRLVDSEGRQFFVDADAMVSAPMSESSRKLAVLSADINPGDQVDVAAIFATPGGAKPTLMVLHESADSPGATVNLT
jgi:Domain of unknown function (DUF4352)